MKRSTLVAAGAMVVAGMATSAFAHPGHGTSFESGAVHPIVGLDHLLAAIASGLLAIRVGSKKAMWLVPAAFVALMLLGGFLASDFVGLKLSGVESVISASVIILGLMVAAMPKVPMWVAATLVGAFSLCHGFAHVKELGGNSLLPYMSGFVMTTALLHVGAIAIGAMMMKAEKPVLVRVAGAAIATGFAVMLAAGIV